MAAEGEPDEAFPPLMPDRFEDEGDTREDIDDLQLRLSHNVTAVAVDPRVPNNAFTALMDSIDSEPPPKMPERRLPEVDVAEFGPYLQRVAQGYALFVSSHGSGSHAESADGGRAGFANALARAKATHSNAAGALLNVADGIQRETSSAAGSAEVARVFDEVPSVFFRQDFSLASPDTFHTVTNLATPMVLDEKLSHYLDLVEVSLLTQISKRSGSFFRALVQLQEFEGDVARACLLVNNMRQYLRSLRGRVIAGSLRVLQLRRRRGNALSLQQTLRRVDELRAVGASVRSLLERGAYQAALAAIESAHAVMKDELAGLRCIGPIARQLDEYKALLVETVAGRFLTLAVTWEPASWSQGGEEDSGEAATAGNGAGTDMEWSAEAARSYALELQTQLLPLAEGLLLPGALSPSALLQRYRQRATEELTGLVKTVVSASLASLLPAPGGTKREGSRIGRQLRALDAQGFHSLLTLVCTQLRLVVLRAHTTQRVVQHALDQMRERTQEREARGSGPEEEEEEGKWGRRSQRQAGAAGHGTVSASARGRPVELRAWEHEALEREAREVADHVWRLCQRHVTKMLEVREEVNVSLGLTSLRALWRLLRRFADDVEEATSLPGEHLLSTVLSQARQFLDRNHGQSTARLREALDSEDWRAAPVPKSATARVEAISRATAARGSPSDAGGDDGSAAATGTGQSRRALVGRAARTLRVAGRQYPIVSSLLVLLDLIATQLEMLSEFPSMAADVFARVLELLRLFNARSTQLVLGAGAVTGEKATLRTISARHLAVLSQSLRAVMALCPTLRAAFAHHLPARQHLLLQQLDRVSRDYAEHVNKIAAKFVSILRDLIRDHCGPSLRAVDWEAAAEEGASKPTPPMRELIANTTRLHQVLTDVLAPEQVKDVFSRAVSMFEVALPEAFASVDPSPMSAAARRRLLADLNLLAEAFRGLGLGSASDLILVHFQSRFGTGLEELRVVRRTDGPAATTDSGPNHQPPQGEEEEEAAGEGGRAGSGDTDADRPTPAVVVDASEVLPSLAEGEEEGDGRASAGDGLGAEPT